jgi:hypothetical protein
MTFGGCNEAAQDLPSPPASQRAHCAGHSAERDGVGLRQVLPLDVCGEHSLDEVERGQVGLAIASLRVPRDPQAHQRTRAEVDPDRVVSGARQDEKAPGVAGCPSPDPPPPTSLRWGDLASNSVAGSACRPIGATRRGS